MQCQQIIDMLAFLLLAGVCAASSSSQVTIDPSGPSFTYDGAGGLSAGASSRLLVDYEEGPRSEISSTYSCTGRALAKHYVLLPVLTWRAWRPSPALRSEILDFLNKPKFGANMHICKVE